MGKNTGFLLRMLIFIAPLVALTFWAEARLGKVPNNYNQKRKYLESQLNEINILVLGSSQAFEGIDPDSFSLKGFNLANFSQDLYYDEALTLKYIDRMPELKVVVVPLNYTSLYGQLKDLKIDAWRLYFYYQFWGINNPGMSMWDSKCYSKYMLYTPFVSLKYLAQRSDTFEFKGNLHSVGSTIKPNGYFSNKEDGNKPMNLETGKKWIDIHNGIIATGKKTEVRAQLDGLLKKLAERHLKIVFINMPAYNTYTSLCDTNVLRSNKLEIDTLCKQYGATYYDYFKDPRFTAPDFADDDHLDPAGAAKFSAILNKEAILPALQKTER